MAIEKAIETPDGVEHEAAYWRVTEVDFDLVAQRTQLKLSAYHNETAARAGKASVGQRWIVLEGDHFELPAGLLEAAYRWAKEAKDIAVPAKRDDQYEPGEARLPDTMVGFFDGAVDV